MAEQGTHRPRRPRDVNELAFSLVEEATTKAQPAPDKKDPKRVASGRKGGTVGGKARARMLSPERRREIARHAALARWQRS